MALMAPGLTLLHLLVVHTVTYRGLKQMVGVKIRNVSIGCIWLLCLSLTCLFDAFWVYTYLVLGLLSISLILVSLCSFFILVVLMRCNANSWSSAVKVHECHDYTGVLCEISERLCWCGVLAGWIYPACCYYLLFSCIEQGDCPVANKAKLRWPEDWIRAAWIR